MVPNKMDKIWRTCRGRAGSLVEALRVNAAQHSCWRSERSHSRRPHAIRRQSEQYNTRRRFRTFPLYYKNIFFSLLHFISQLLKDLITNELMEYFNNDFSLAQLFANLFCLPHYHHHEKKMQKSLSGTSLSKMNSSHVHKNLGGHPKIFFF